MNKDDQLILSQDESEDDKPSAFSPQRESEGGSPIMVFANLGGVGNAINQEAMML